MAPGAAGPQRGARPSSDADVTARGAAGWGRRWELLEGDLAGGAEPPRPSFADLIRRLPPGIAVVDHSRAWRALLRVWAAVA
eukprot:gene56198-38472_t